MNKLPNFLFYLFLLVPTIARAQFEGNKYVSAKIISDKNAISKDITSGETLSRIGVLFKIEDGWHIYWRNSGSAGMPTKVSWNLPEGIGTDDISWPLPTQFAERGNITTYGYTKQVLLFTQLKTNKNLTSKILKFSADVSWLVCKDICVPGKTTISKELPVEETSKPSEDKALFDQYSTMIPETMSNLKIETFPSNSSPATGKDEKLIIKISGLKQALDEKNLSKNMQIFPYENKPIKFGKPLLHKQEQQILVSLPYGASSAINQDFSTKLLLTISGSLVNKSEDVGLEIPVLFSSGTRNNAEFKSLSDSIQDKGEELTAREHDNTLIVSSPAQVPTNNNSSKGLFFILISAFIGGALLNLMPCVLPIIGIKVMGFIGKKDYPRSKAISSALFFSAGIMASFFILASVVVTLKSLGYTIGWGFQFQHPEFVFVVTIIVFLFGLAFFDVYEISLPGLQKANSKLSKIESGYIKDFFDGVLATALSTPCTAPFLGSALVFAFSQPPLFSYLVFLTVGLGLALPYALCSTSPTLLNLLPKPGNWMYSLREFMGFLLLGTVIWLLFVLNKLTQDGIVWMLVILLTLYFSFWLAKIGKRSESAPTRAITKLGSLLILAGVLFHFYPYAVAPRTVARGQVSTSKIPWEKYSPEILLQAEKEGRAVFIDFTADWCITCKANEFLIIETDSVIGGISKYNILPVKADWTDGNDEITKLLTSYGAQGVPYYVIIPANRKLPPITLPTIPSVSGLINAFKEASSK